MRLTLRNLLRFLDQTDLGSLERQRLEELVEQSDRASAWIERIRSLRSDPARSAPRLQEEPLPAEVAQYLDGSLSEQEIVGFEETMLASDQILAEVASCHLIGQRLGTADAPAISVALRQSLYDIDRLHAASAENRSADADADASTAMEDLPFVDASDADQGIYEEMMRNAEPITDEERPFTVSFASGRPAEEAVLPLVAAIEAQVDARTEPLGPDPKPWRPDA